MLASNETVKKRNKHVGSAHWMVFWGFIGLFIATSIVAVDYDVYGNLTDIFLGHRHSFLWGPFYLAFNLVFNAAGLVTIIGMIALMLRRAFSREPQLDYRRAEKPASGYSRKNLVLGDWLFMGLILAILITGFLLQGLRIDMTHFPSFERWTWFGYLIASGMSALGIDAARASAAHPYMWWLHSGMALIFVAYVPYSKAMHIFTGAANLFVTDPGSPRHLPAPPKEADHVGYKNLADFSWKELLDLDSCTKCGRCHYACPARTGGAPLSPRDLILDLRQWADEQSGIHTIMDWETRPERTGPLAPATVPEIVGEVIKERTLWSCTTCMACVEACPVGIEHVPLIVNLRRRLVDQGKMEPTLQGALQAIAQQGNSFGKSSRMRARWTKGLDFPIKDARKEPVEHLWFVGDFASFDDRLQRLSQTLARVLHAAGVDFGILYDDEWNAGNDVRRVGEEGLFELLVEHNVAALAAAQFSDIFTTDPHSYNTLRNEYPVYGLEKRVRHYSQLLAGLLRAETLPVRQLGYRVTYHDPCYLGRYNRVTQPPRSVLAGIGCSLVEMPRNRDNTFCCGAGGGRIWMVDDSQVEERPSENRIREAVGLGVEYFVVACPKDYTMYSDAVKTTGHEGDLKVVDLVELVAEALVTDELAPAASVAGEQR
jgi:Fe-S oxidoreductase